MIRVEPSLSSGVPDDRQRQGTSERDIWWKLQFCVGGQSQARQTSREFLQHDSRLQSCKRTAETKVRAMAEGKMIFRVGPANVEAIGIREDVGIPISRAQQQQQLRARR